MMKLLIGCCILWIALASCSSTRNLETEREAIRRLLEKEAATWRSGDVAAHAACWHVQPYSRILVSLPDGQVIDVPPQAVVNPKPEDMGLGGKAELYDMRMDIHGDRAWVNHRERSTGPDGTVTESYEFRLLEKIRGEWKLVGQSIMIVGK
jgi:hypothetical protein